MSYEFFIALRHFKSKRKEKFISVITLISIFGVMLGVMALIVVLSVMKGFEKDMRDKILGANAHLVVFKLGGEIKDYKRIMEDIRHAPDVKGVSPFVYSQVMLTSQRKASGVVLKGIDVDTVGDVTVLPKHIIKGSIKDLKEEKDDEVPGIIIGSELADTLNVESGDIIDVVSPMGTQTPYGLVPLKVGFRVVGIFRFGMYEYDSNLAFISLESARSFLGMEGGATGIEVKVADIFRAKEVGGNISSMLRSRFGGLYIVKDWMELNRNLFSALKLERITMFVILTLIILVAAFNIVGTLIMVVMEKSKEIAVLMSMGARKKGIMKIFITEGLIIGSVGTLLGIFGAFAANMLLSKYHFIKLPKDIYYIDSLPVVMDPYIFLIVALASLLISFLATIYPSWKASRLNVIEAIRYE